MTWTPLADGPGDALDEAVPHVAANTPGRLISNSRGGRGSGNAPGVRRGRSGWTHDRSAWRGRGAIVCAARRRSLRRRPRRGPVQLAGPDVLERQGFQAGLAVAVGNSGAEPDFDVGGRLQL